MKFVPALEKTVKKHSQSMVFLVLAIVTTGCAVSSREPTSQPVSDIYSAISFAGGSFNPVQGESFAWYAAPLWASAQNSSRLVLGVELQNAINDNLRSKGYRVVTAHADYMIGLAIVTEGGSRSDDINAFFSLFPQLAEDEAGYDKGRILAGVIPGDSLSSPQTGATQSELLWRAAIEAYILDLEPESPESKERVAGLTGILLNSIP